MNPSINVGQDDAEYSAVPKPYLEAAIAEGWSLFECSGSIYGKWQVQKLDEVEEGGLRDDEEAMKIVANGTEPHHKWVLEFIEKHCPEEYERVISFKEQAR